MKKIILIIALLSSYAISGFTNEAEMKAVETANENARLCKVFAYKVETYESTMRNDDLAKATLVSYKQRMSSFCDTSKVKSDKAEVKTVAAVETKPKTVLNASESARLCNIFTDKVQTYEATMRNDDLAEATLVSYKQRMSTFCNTSTVKS